MPLESKPKRWRNASTYATIFVMLYTIFWITRYGCEVSMEEGFSYKYEPAHAGWLSFFTLMLVPCSVIIFCNVTGGMGCAVPFVIGSVALIMLLLFIWTCWEANNQMEALDSGYGSFGSFGGYGAFGGYNYKVPNERRIIIVMQVLIDFAHFFAIYVGNVVLFITARAMDYGVEENKNNATVNNVVTGIQLASNQVTLKFIASERAGINYEFAEVTSVSGQAERLGVKAGWKMVTINGETYTEDRLIQAASGRYDYEIVFAVPVTGAGEV